MTGIRMSISTRSGSRRSARYCFPPIASRAHHLDAVRFQQAAQSIQHQGMIIGQLRRAYGTSTSTHVPSPGAVCTCKLPPRDSTRSRMKTSPKWRCPHRRIDWDQTLSVVLDAHTQPAIVHSERYIYMICRGMLAGVGEASCRMRNTWICVSDIKTSSPTPGSIETFTWMP